MLTYLLMILVTVVFYVFGIKQDLFGYIHRLKLASRVLNDTSEELEPRLDYFNFIRATEPKNIVWVKHFVYYMFTSLPLFVFLSERNFFKSYGEVSFSFWIVVAGLAFISLYMEVRFRSSLDAVFDGSITRDELNQFLESKGETDENN
jgi:hypothetical protein